MVATVGCLQAQLANGLFLTYVLYISMDRVDWPDDNPSYGYLIKESVVLLGWTDHKNLGELTIFLCPIKRLYRLVSCIGVVRRSFVMKPHCENNRRTSWESAKCHSHLCHCENNHGLFCFLPAHPVQAWFLSKHDWPQTQMGVQSRSASCKVPFPPSGLNLKCNPFHPPCPSLCSKLVIAPSANGTAERKRDCSAQTPWERKRREPSSIPPHIPPQCENSMWLTSSSSVKIFL